MGRFYVLTLSKLSYSSYPLFYSYIYLLECINVRNDWMKPR